MFRQKILKLKKLVPEATGLRAHYLLGINVFQESDRDPLQCQKGSHVHRESTCHAAGRKRLWGEGRRAGDRQMGGVCVFSIRSTLRGDAALAKELPETLKLEAGRWRDCDIGRRRDLPPLG